MKKALIKFLCIYFLFVMVFVILRPLFLAVYVSDAGISDWFASIWHGMAMDFSVAGYLAVVPGLLIISSLIFNRRWPGIALDIYMFLASSAISLIYCLDLGLYGSWGFRLDMTPVFYITTSISSAMASVTWWQWLTGIPGIIALAALIWLAYRLTVRKISVKPCEGKWKWGAPIIMLLATALLFIPIRGSFTVSTMNLSRAYFSENQKLNHAAINPAFSLMYSATHQDNFDTQYNFMSHENAENIVDSFLWTNAANQSAALTGNPNDSTVFSATELISRKNPDIVLIILESFSAHLMPSLGGEDIASGLDSIARQGVSFTNFYASSFRTDRALPAILSAFPAPTNTSIMKYVEKFEKIPSLPKALSQEGYKNSYYYGGDANFTNMQAYLVSSGFSNIISDKDFKLSEVNSKWGALDEKVFNRAYDDLETASYDKISTAAPKFTVIQTSSSHEPFEVPYANPRFSDNPRKNAFAYTDSCLTGFVNRLASLPNWDNTLVVMVADHYGCWPQDIQSPLERHHIPLVMTGGALTRRNYDVNKLSSQTDIAATLLSMLGISHSQFRFSRDIFASEATPAAIFTEPSLVAVITPGDTLIYNPDADRLDGSFKSSGNTLKTKAFIRHLYSILGRL